MRHDPHRRPPTIPQDLAATVRSARIFSRLTDAQLQTLARRARLVSLAADETPFRHGERTRARYLARGQLQLCRGSGAGDELIIDLLEAGTTFGETDALSKDSHFHLSCASLVDAEIAAVDLPTFLAVLHGSVGTPLLLLRRISEWVERHVGISTIWRFSPGISSRHGPLSPDRRCRSQSRRACHRSCR